MSSLRLAGNEESDEPEEPPELGRMTELIAKELNESVSAIVINANTCLRNVGGRSPECRGSMQDCASDDSRLQPRSGSSLTVEHSRRCPMAARPLTVAA